MNLPFNTTINNEPNFFIEKIWLGLIENGISNITECCEYQRNHIEKFEDVWDYTKSVDLFAPIAPKIHTIRKNYERFTIGSKLHLITGNRTPNRFQFAPVLECKTIQKIRIAVEKNNNSWWNIVEVEGKMLEWKDVETLAKNDGFSEVKEFFAYFCNNYESEKAEFNGGIIGWTTLKY